MYNHDINPDPYPVGAVLTSNDPEPMGGTVVRDDNGALWRRDNSYEHGVNWCMHPNGIEYETWTKVAGNYGPVAVVEPPDDGDIEYARRWLT